jgi:hypothetical protein
MKITNQNIESWLLGLLFLLWCYSMIIYEIPAKPTPMGMLNFTGLAIFGVGALFFSGMYLLIFLSKCKEDEIQFEIDLTKIFKSSRISPEEEDKQNK